MVRAAASRGLPESALLEGTRVEASALDQPEARLPVAVDAMLWARAAQLLGDDGLGLEVASGHVSAETFGVVGFVAMTSATLHDALAISARFHSLLCGSSRLRYRMGGVAELTHEPGPMPRPDIHAEAALATVLALARAWSGAKLRGVRVCFRHPRPPHADRLGEFFGVMPLFGQRDTALVLSRDDAAMPLRSRNHGLREYLVRRAEADRTQANQALIDEVREAVASELDAASGVSLAAVADRLGVTPRTLQRRLREFDLGFRDLVLDVRMTLAGRLLATSSGSVAAVASKLGYSTAAAFRRAFARWSGLTPGGYRAQHRRASSDLTAG